MCDVLAQMIPVVKLPLLCRPEERDDRRLSRRIGLEVFPHDDIGAAG
jgi:hypothetical protein